MAILIKARFQIVKKFVKTLYISAIITFWAHKNVCPKSFYKV